MVGGNGWLEEGAVVSACMVEPWKADVAQVMGQTFPISTFWSRDGGLSARVRWEADCSGFRTQVSDDEADPGWLMYGVGADGEMQLYCCLGCARSGFGWRDWLLVV